MHNSLKTGTLHAILTEVAEKRTLTNEEIAVKL